MQAALKAAERGHLVTLFEKDHQLGGQLNYAKYVDFKEDINRYMEWAIRQVNKNENIIYPGSTISLGFDELGEHGMVVGEINKNEKKLEFIKLDETEFVEKEINCTEINSIEELIEKINEINIEKNKLYKIILIGKRNFEINIYDLYKYELNEKIIKIKNKTKPNYNLEEISKENTLRGLFAKEILEEIKNKNYNEEIIENALEIGMEILE